MQVSAWMKTNPYCVTADAHLDAVERAMHEGGFRHAPVVDGDGRLVGMISDRDLREHRGHLASTLVSAAVSEPAVAASPEDPIERAAQLMLRHKIGGLPVVDAAQRVVGIVTATDILHGFLDGLGTGERSARIDFQLASPSQGLSDAVQAVERAGGIVLGVGTFQATADGSGARRFFVRISAAQIEPIVDALAQGGVHVVAVHHLPDQPA